jgi:Zn-dependent protease
MDLIQLLLLGALPVMFAITLHEAAHGYAARHFGDPTAWQAGRISINPLRHIDPIGTVLVPGILLWLGGFLFGWAKPVPVDFSRLRNPKRDMFWVAFAGPGANLLMAICWAVLLKAAIAVPGSPYSLPLGIMSKIGINVNVALFVLNLLPLPPLDGGRIAVSLLPYPLAVKFAQLERWGFPILLLMLFFGVLGAVLGPLASMVHAVLSAVFQIPR